MAFGKFSLSLRSGGIPSSRVRFDLVQCAFLDPRARFPQRSSAMGGFGRALRKKVVVVGGGIAGALLAKSIQFQSDVTLIDPKEYFEITWANLRSKVEPSLAERAVINHSEYSINGRIITSSAVNITETDVLTTEGRKIPYSTPRTRRDRLEQFQEENIKINFSGSILIVGAGPTGVELAGEIAMDYPDKKVTLVHRGPRLLEFYWVESFLESTRLVEIEKCRSTIGTID